MAIHFNNAGFLFAIKSIANVNNTNFITIKNSGETFKAHAITGFASSTPLDTAYNVKLASTKLHTWHISNQASAINSLGTIITMAKLINQEIVLTFLRCPLY